MSRLNTMQFFGSLLGQRMVHHEFNWLRRQLRTCVGTHAAVLSCDPYASLKPLFADFYMIVHATERRWQASNIHCDFNALPIPNKSMDVVVLHHALSNSANPIEVLREVDRILVPGGRLFILGENRYSLYGLADLVGKTSLQTLGENRYSARRIKEWLAALDIQTQSLQTVMHEPPLNRHWVLRKFSVFAAWCARQALPFGGVYCMAAIKSARPVTPIKLRKILWQPSLSSNPVAQTKLQGANESNRNLYRRRLSR